MKNGVPRTWHVGGFTVKKFPLPSDFSKKSNRAEVVGSTLLTVGAKAPYPVTWRSLTSQRAGTVRARGCPVNTLFAYVDLNNPYPPGDAALVCEGRKKGALTIIHVPDMKVSTFPLPGRPKGASEYFLDAVAFGWPEHPHLLWFVDNMKTLRAGSALGSWT